MEAEHGAPRPTLRKLEAALKNASVEPIEHLLRRRATDAARQVRNARFIERKLKAATAGVVAAMDRAVGMHNDKAVVVDNCMLCLCHMAAGGGLKDATIRSAIEVVAISDHLYKGLWAVQGKESTHLAVPKDGWESRFHMRHFEAAYDPPPLPPRWYLPTFGGVTTGGPPVKKRTSQPLDCRNIDTLYLMVGGFGRTNNLLLELVHLLLFVSTRDSSGGLDDGGSFVSGLHLSEGSGGGSSSGKRLGRVGLLLPPNSITSA